MARDTSPWPARAIAALAIALLAFAPLRAASGGASAPGGFRTSSSAAPVRGVERYNAHRPGEHAATIARFDPGAAVNLLAGVGGDRIGGTEPVSSMCRRTGCLVGINGDFFGGGEPSGGVVSNGVLVRSPSRDHVQLVVTPDGRFGAGTLGWEAHLEGQPTPPPPASPSPDPPVEDVAEEVPADPTPPPDVAPTPEPTPAPTPPAPPPPDRVRIAGVNVPARPDAVVMYTRHWRPTTGTTAEWSELTVRLGGDVLLSGDQHVDPIAFSAGAGDAPIPAGGAVLAGHGAGAEELRRIWDRAQRGLYASVRIASSVTATDVWSSIGGGPVLVRNGEIPDLGNTSFATGRHPRTLVGWDRTGRRWFVTVDGRQPSYSTGMTLRQAAEFMVALGATDALNLDGGGSTTFVEQGRVANRPIHQKVPGRERPVANSLLAIATEPLITPPPPTPRPTRPPRAPTTPRPIAPVVTAEPTPVPTPEPTRPPPAPELSYAAPLEEDRPVRGPVEAAAVLMLVVAAGAGTTSHVRTRIGGRAARSNVGGSIAPRPAEPE